MCERLENVERQDGWSLCLEEPLEVMMGFVVRLAVVIHGFGCPASCDGQETVPRYWPRLRSGDELRPLRVSHHRRPTIEVLHAGWSQQ
jgi:hypothetical protein